MLRSIVIAMAAAALTGNAGELITPAGPCPLKRTDVKAEISGFLGRVTVTQQFQNPFKDKIEAVYTFPLPQYAAVDDMTMLVGQRTIRGVIKRREEARAIYEQARERGHVASLLDQERPPDASRITPHVAEPGTRAGHDIGIEVALDAGLPIDKLDCPTHEIVSERPGLNRATVRLKDKDTIPNKDFILRYDVAGRRISDAVLTHNASRGGFFTLILQPPERAAAAEITPKELVFVLDTSGSMSGFPIEKAKETMRLALNGLNPQDTFNLITFSGDTQILFQEPQPATQENLQRARDFLASRYGRGGTEMMKAIRAALDPSDSQSHIRVVCFMTDGYVGNDMEIISEVQKHPNARVFSFGIGSSVNRFLLDAMAKYGRGEVEYVGLNDDGSAAAKRFHERVRSPLLTDITIDWGNLPVAEVYPARIPDLFSAKPLILSGRFTRPASATIRLRGKAAGRDFTRDIRVDLPSSEPRHDVLATLWARRKVSDLMSRDFGGIQNGTASREVREGIITLGLEFRLMTQFTSFVAVEVKIVTDGGQPRRVEVPVEMPEGVSHEGVFGERVAMTKTAAFVASGIVAMEAQRSRGMVGGTPGGVIGGIITAAPQARPAPRDLSTMRDKAKRDKLLEKLAPSLVAAFRSGSQEKLKVQVMLTDTSPQSMAQLKALGFEVISEPKTGKITTGRIAANLLEKLANLAFVKYVSPL